MDVLRTNWIITALSDFVIMYTAELWVFLGGLTRGGHVPVCCLLRAYYACLRYHLGSMVLGGMVVGFLQPIRLAFSVISFVVQIESASSGILSCCCGWAARPSPFDGCNVPRVQRNAGVLMLVAMDSQGFQTLSR